MAGNGDVGGVAGYTYHQVTACHSDATVRLPAYFNQPLACVGGIIGVAQSYSVDREGVISDCYFNGTVENSAGYVPSLQYQIDSNFLPDGWRSYMARAVKNKFKKPVINAVSLDWYATLK